MESAGLRVHGPLEHTLTEPFEPDRPDWAIVEAARSGSVEAFNVLVERYQVLAYNVAYRTTGQAEDAADATQDAFMSAFRSLRSFRGQSFKPWLLRIVVNACYDVLRRRQRASGQSLEVLNDAGPDRQEPTDDAAGPEIAALQAETSAAIQSCLDTLSDEHRLVVVLCDVQELSYEEAAEIIDVPVGTIRSRLSRARARLREALIARGELPDRAERPHIEGLSRT